MSPVGVAWLLVGLVYLRASGFPLSRCRAPGRRMDTSSREAGGPVGHDKRGRDRDEDGGPSRSDICEKSAGPLYSSKI